jgi:hypothetical protein
MAIVRVYYQYDGKYREYSEYHEETTQRLLGARAPLRVVCNGYSYDVASRRVIRSHTVAWGAGVGRFIVLTAIDI